jgi:phosphatidylglycerol lysyltransferase
MQATPSAPSEALPAPKGPRRWLRFLPALIALVLCAMAAFFLHHELSQHSWRELRDSVVSIPGRQVLAAVLLTAASYTVLTGYDALALHTVGIPLPYRKTIVASFLGYVFSHNVGLSVLGGSAARFRMYSSSGLTASDVVKVFAFCALTFWLGLLALAGSVLILAPEHFSSHVPVPPALVRGIGIVLEGATVAYVWLCWRRREPLRIRKWEFPLPRPALAVLQIALSVVDWTVAGSVLFALLPHPPELTFFRFLGVFLAAQLVAVTSHVPGGLGVFDGFVLALLRDEIDAARILGALLAYRMIYYLAPLAVGIVLLAAHELGRHGKLALRIADAMGNAFAEVSPRVVPRLLAFSTFWSGVVLLYSGATPPDVERLGAVGRSLPLPLIESAHLLGSLCGVALLLLARGLYERLRLAWKASIALVALGIVTALAKGLDWEEAGLLLLVLGGLVPCRDHFTRRASLFRGPPTLGWTAASSAVIVATAILARSSFRHEYANELWWTFSLHESAPRALRANVAAAALAFAFGVTRLLRPLQPEPEPPTPNELEQARQLARTSPDSFANLALVGDRPLLFSADGDGFVMYSVEGGSWIALGDPVGPPDETKGLVRRFHELARKHGGRTVFFEVLGDRLPLYVDLGLVARKVGEEARVELASFALDGDARPEVRRACAALEKAGATFELVPSAAVAPLTDELARVSVEWLHRAPLRPFPVAVVRVSGRVVAFARLWLHEDEAPGAAATGSAPEPSREELTIDLLRASASAPAGTVEFLVARTMALARDLGFAWFSLGVAPLAELEQDAVALWQKLAGTQQPRRWLERFAPTWRPRYLASPGGTALPAVMKDVIASITSATRDRASVRAG